MNITVQQKREYIPEFNGNRELPAVEQVKVLHRAATIKIKEALFPKKYEYDSNGEMKGSFELDRSGMMLKFITDIKNFSYEEDGVSYKIKTAAQLIDAPSEFEELLDELYSYFQELLNKKVDEKNSE